MPYERKLNSGRNPLELLGKTLHQTEVWYQGVHGLDREGEIYGQVNVKVMQNRLSVMPARRVISKLSGYNFTLVTHRFFLLAPHSRSYFALLSHSIEPRFLEIKIFSSENLPFSKHLWEVLEWKRFRYTNPFAKLKIFGILILQFVDSETWFDWQPFGRKKDFVLFSKK